MTPISRVSFSPLQKEIVIFLLFEQTPQHHHHDEFNHPRVLSLGAMIWYNTIYFSQAIVLVVNETKQTALVLLWEHLSDGKGLVVSYPVAKWEGIHLL